MANPLVLDNVMKQFGEKTAVNNISLQVEEGEIYGLLGANGAGKNDDDANGVGIDLSGWR